MGGSAHRAGDDTTIGGQRLRSWARVGAAGGLVAALWWAFAAVAAVAAVDPGPSYYGGGDTADAYGRSGVTWVGTPAYAAGHTGAPGDRAFVIGPGGVLTLNDPDVGNFGTADFTLNLHVQLAAAPDDRAQILSKRAGCAGGSFLDLRAGTEFGGVHFEIQDLLNYGFNVVNPANVFDGRWHQITARRSGTLVSLTVDGVTTSATSLTVVDIDTAEPMRFGDGGCVTGPGQLGDGTARASGRLDAISFGPGSEIVGPPTTPPTDPPPPPTTSPRPPPTTAPPPTGPPGTTPPPPTPPPAPGPPASVPGAPTSPADRASFDAGADVGARADPGRTSGIVPGQTTTPVAGTTTSTTATTRPAGPGGSQDAESDESAVARGGQERSGERSGTGGAASGAVPRLDAGAAFVESLSSPREVPTRVAVLVQNALLAILLLTLLALPVGIVNDTAEDNAPRFAAAAARVQRLRQLVVVPWVDRWRFTIGLAVAALVGSVIYGFVEPAFGFDLSSLALVLGFAVAFLLVSAAKELSQFAFLRRAYDIRGFLQLFPAFALVAVACVTVSRAVGLQPGLILGTLAALGVRADLDMQRKGRAVAVSAGALAGLGILAWVVRSAVVADGPPDGFVVTVVSVALTAVAVAVAEHLAFGLLPLSFLDGAALFRWSKVVWAGFTASGAFAFVHVLLQREAGDFADRVSYLLVLLLVYFAGALAFWAWFRFRPDHSRPADPPGDPPPTTS